MNIAEKTEAILFIRPDAEFVLRGDEIEWLDKEQTEPTTQEIQSAYANYSANKEAELKAKAEKRQAILDKLGLTAEEVAVLLG